MRNRIQSLDRLAGRVVASGGVSDWIAPAAAYVLLLGALGVSVKVALRDVTWETTIAWTAVTYVVIAAFLLARGRASLSFGAGTIASIVTAMLASGGLIAFYLALDRGEASKVVPVTSVYPVVTVVLSAIVLAERITPTRVIGALVVVAGVAILGLGR
jgi:bacterial/archaeal transporter family protein